MRPPRAAFLALFSLAPSILTGQAQRLVVQMRPFTHPIVLDSLARSREYAAPAGTAFQAVLEVFESLKIPVTTRDSARGIVANLHLIKSGSLGGGPLSRYLNCGQGLTGPYADNHRVTLLIAALIDALPNGRSRVGFALAASSRDMAGHSVEPNACETSGILENRMADWLQERLARRQSPP